MSIRNKKGQIAIFIVLVFQVLFILFAMTINISMVAYDKINFQNSLDLAAYYGAKQQAEVLSAMAHINYQMRQNWKLLAWRYRILGTMLQIKGDSARTPSYWCPQNKDYPSKRHVCTPDDCRYNTQCITACNQARSSLPIHGNYCDLQYFVCVSNMLWRRGIASSRQNLCQILGISVQPIRPLPPVAPFMPEAHLAERTSSRLQDEVSHSCPMEGALNGLTAQFFLTHFRLDQADRKTMIREIYKNTLGVGNDLDGKSIFEGAKKVFYNNLTKTNKENVQSIPHYGLVPSKSFYESKSFEYFFGHMNVFPVLQYLYFPGTNPGDCNAVVRRHEDFNLDDAINKLINTNPPPPDHPFRPLLMTNKIYLKRLFDLNKTYDPHEMGTNPILSLTLGFYKKPGKIFYYGLKGEFPYSGNQIFSLNLNPVTTFKASSFAKPFGGRFGPQPAQKDPWIPVNASIPPSRTNTFLLQPNYSRWPGDKWGLIRKKLHSNSSGNHFLRKYGGSLHTAYEFKQVYSIGAFIHLILFSGADDPLSRPDIATGGSDAKANNFMRMMELMAVYPDAFDLSFYSIAGNYMKTYFPRICKLLAGRECSDSAARYPIRGSFSGHKPYIRGDFGWPYDHYFKKNQDLKDKDLSIAPLFLQDGDTENIVSREISIRYLPLAPSHSSYPYPIFSQLTSGKLFYAWLSQKLPAHLLTSWAPKAARERYDEYPFPDDKFLNCGINDKGVAKQDRPVPSSCAIGGRSDYSVKLISCETVRDLDPQPGPGWVPEEYCSH